MKLTKEKALSEARVVMMSRMPFWSTLMYRMLRLSWNEGIPTAACDGRNVYINPEFFCSLPPGQRAFVLAHETAHAMFRHMKRGKFYHGRGLFGQPFNDYLWNVAIDYVVNAMLAKSGADVWPHAFLDMEKFPPEMSAEEAYKKLLSMIPPQAGGGGQDGDSDGDGDGQSDGSGNSGSSGQSLPGMNGEVLDDHVYADDQRSDMQWKQAVAEAAMVAKERGKLPADLQRFVDEMLEPKVDWREELRAEITARAKGEHVSWKRPNRRGKILFDAYLPSYFDMRTGCIVIEIDTSGSISSDELRRFLSETASILADCPPDELWLLSVDASIHTAVKVEDLNELEEFARTGLKGGGGTDMTAGFRWVEAHGVEPDFMLVMTDGYTPFGDDPGYPVIWAMSTDVEAPYGKTIHIEGEAS